MCSVKFSIHPSVDTWIPRSRTQRHTENGNTRKYHRHIHLPTLDPAYYHPHPPMQLNFTRSHFIHWVSLHPHRKWPRSQAQEVPPKEREDEYDSQTLPQGFMQPQEEYPYLHTSKWIQYSQHLHIAFALEIESSGNWCIEFSSSTHPHTVFTAFIDS